MPASSNPACHRNSNAKDQKQDFTQSSGSSASIIVCTVCTFTICHNAIIWLKPWGDARAFFHSKFFAHFPHTCTPNRNHTHTHSFIQHVFVVHACVGTIKNPWREQVMKNGKEKITESSNTRIHLQKQRACMCKCSSLVIQRNHSPGLLCILIHNYKLHSR